jgi:predicted LPLAT superfamily acyltransferase
MTSLARAFRVLSLAAIPCAAGGCITNPKAEALRQQQMIEFGDAMNDVRLNVTEMAGTLDSLRVVIAKQDTTIARLANVTGVVVVK